MLVVWSVTANVFLEVLHNSQPQHRAFDVVTTRLKDMAAQALISWVTPGRPTMPAYALLWQAATMAVK